MNKRTDHDHDGTNLQARAVKYKRDFWATENLSYSAPQFRSRKVGRVLRRLAGGRECDVLDVGCGPGSLGTILPPNIHYYGIDISIPKPAPNFLEIDILENPIGFHGRQFDLIVAQGMFEYVADQQSKKFAEIAALLKGDGKFVLTYQNFGHLRRQIYYPYSNVQPPADFRADLGRFFTIERYFPGSHNLRHSIPQRPLLQLSQAYLNVNIPVISRMLAVDYLYICSPLPRG
jgi:SAM-dependent methyltransferase